MNKLLTLPYVLSLTLGLAFAGTFSVKASAAELPQAGTFATGAQLSLGNIDHDSFKGGDDGVAQIQLYADYYFMPGWAVELGVNHGTNVQDWVCKHVDNPDDDYCLSDADDDNSALYESDLDFSNFIVALRYDNKITDNSFIYGKLGGQYFDYEMTNHNAVFEEDSGTGIFSELGWRYQWGDNFTANVGYQHIGMSKLSTSALTIGVGYFF